MAQVKVTNFQYPLVANTEVTAADVGQELVIDVQPGFILTGAVVIIRTVFNGTTPVFTLVDNKASPTTIIASTGSGSAAATAASTALYTEYPAGGKIRILFTVSGGTTTTGRADVIVQGIARGRQNERIGANIAT